MPKLIGMGSWAVHDQGISFEKFMDELVRLVYNAVELGAFGDHPTPDSHSTAESRAELKKSIEDRGLTLSGVAIKLWGQDLFKTDDQSGYISEFKRNSDFVAAIQKDGLETAIRVDGTHEPQLVSEIGYEKARNRTVAAWQEACDYAKGNNQYVTWEPEPGFAFNRVREIIGIYHLVNRDNFNIMLDISHAECIGVEGHRQYDSLGRLTSKHMRRTYADQTGLYKELYDAGVCIGHLHIIGSDGELHDDPQTSNHCSFEKQGDRLKYDEIMGPLAETSNLVNPIWTIDACFNERAWKDMEHNKKFIDGLNDKYGDIPYKPKPQA